MSNIAKQAKQSQMYSLVEKWQNSSSSKTKFCLENNLNIGIFNYWLKKYTNKSKGFIEIKIEPEKEEFRPILSVKFEFGGNISAEVPAELALKFMHQLISV